MKKKIMASLLVGSAVVGASLAPLSAQAVTTGNTPVQVEFGGGTLPDGNSKDGNSVDLIQKVRIVILIYFLFQENSTLVLYLFQMI